MYDQNEKDILAKIRRNSKPTSLAQYLVFHRNQSSYHVFQLETYAVTLFKTAPINEPASKMYLYFKGIPVSLYQS